jgi:hypothetical protein
MRPDPDPGGLRCHHYCIGYGVMVNITASHDDASTR